MTDEFLNQFSTAGQRKERVGRLMSQILQETVLDSKARQRLRINLEIGCGHGHWLTNHAFQNPNEIFVGIDLISKRIEKAQAKVTKRSLKNLFFLKVEAKEFLEFLSTDFVIDKTYLMFPDPWPKHRHFKRRLIQDEFLHLLAKTSSKESFLFFRSDHIPYVEWTKEKIFQSPYWEIVDQGLPFEHTSYFQDLLPSHQSITAHATHYRS